MQRFHLFALCAATTAGLIRQLQEPAAAPRTAKEEGPEGPLRLAMHARDAAELRALQQLACAALQRDGRIDHPQIFFADSPPAKTAWLFPGQGSQRLGMLASLAQVWPEFSRQLETLDQRWSATLGVSVREWIAAPDNAANAAHLQDTRQAQLALGLVESALAFSWQKIGFTADSFAGHSYGEIPALTAAGAMDADALAEISRARGQLLGEAGDLAPGGMLAVRTGAEALAPLLVPFADRIFVANDNAPEQVVLAGSRADIAEVAAALQAKGVATIPLKTSCAFHSPLMAPVAERWHDFLAGRQFAPIAAGRVFSNISGQAYGGSPDATRDGLNRQIVSPVRWRDEIEALYAAGCRLFVEIGPGHVLTDLTGKILKDRPHVRLASDPEQQAAETFFPALLARLYSLGCNLDLAAFQPRQPDLLTAPIMTTTPTNPPAASDAGFYEANQQAISAFFEQQRQIVAALQGREDGPLFTEMVRANQAVMQEFMATQQAALGLAPSALAIPLVPAPGIGVALPAPVVSPAAPQPAAATAGEDVERWIIAQIAEMTGLPPQRISRTTLFESELGIDSITLVELWIQLVERFPALGQSSGQVSAITCINDILVRLAQVSPAMAAPASAPAPAQAPAPTVAAPTGGVEGWLLNELSMLTGLPVNRLNRDTRFEAELGIDSITMVELWIKLVEKFPQFGAHTDGASRVQSVAEVLRLVGADAPPQPTAKAEVIEHPASNWLAKLRGDLITRIAGETGIDAAKITGQSHFARDLGLDIFTRERILEEEIGRNPKLAFAGRELLNASNLDELTRLLARFNNLMSDKPLRINEDGKIVTSDDASERVERYVLVGQPPVPASELGSLPARILLIGEPGPLYDTMHDRFASCDVAIEPLHLSIAGWHHPGSGKRAAIDDIDGIAGLLADATVEGKLPAIIYLGMSDLSMRGRSDDPAAWRNEIERAGLGLFAFAKAASPIIRTMGGEASVGVLTRQNSPAWAAASGVAKALAKEWPKARIRTVRLLDDIEELAPRMVLKVLTWGPSAHDLQLVRDGVIRQTLVKKPINQDIIQTRVRHPRLSSDSVILLVGGASGITAEASVMLAREYHAHIVATGRTPMPDQYPYQGINDDASLKRILFDELNRSPEHGDVASSVREEHKRIQRQRAIWTTKERVERAGGRFSYYQVDVTQHVALADTLAKVREECGPIHGLIHGAGIIDDCLIEKKTVEEFKAVYYTKAVSVFNLALGLWHDPLRFVFMFSSLASFAGTPGQTDYVAANEVINAMAKFWNARVRYPVRSLLWSVWTETGLIASSAAQRQMARLGLAGISNEQGVKLLHDELVSNNKFDDWVLLTPQSTLDYTTGGRAATLQNTRGHGT